MRKLLFLALFVLAFAPVSFAQTTDTSGPEVFVGYSNLQAEGIGGVDTQDDSFDDEVFGERVGLHGINTSITGFLTPRVGLTGDFSFNQKSDPLNFPAVAGTTRRGDIDTRVLNFLGGPTVKFRNETRVTPFIRALAGVANTRFDVETETRTTTGTSTSTVERDFNTSTTDFALALGGGVDVRVSDRIDLRLIQFDYNPVFFRDRSVQVLTQTGALVPGTIEGQRADNLRFSFGVVFR